MVVEQKEGAQVPVMIKFKQEFRNHRVGGEYDPKQQIRIVHEENGIVPYIQTKDMNGMGSTHTGERAGEH